MNSQGDSPPNPDDKSIPLNFRDEKLPSDNEVTQDNLRDAESMESETPGAKGEQPSDDVSLMNIPDFILNAFENPNVPIFEEDDFPPETKSASPIDESATPDDGMPDGDEVEFTASDDSTVETRAGEAEATESLESESMAAPPEANPGDEESEAGSEDAEGESEPVGGTSLFQFAGDLAAVCYSGLGDWSAARNATAEALVYLLRRLDPDPDETFEALRDRVLETGRRACLDGLRRAAFLADDILAPSRPHDSSFGAMEDGESQLPTEEIRSLVIEWIHSLEEPRRSLMKMRFWNRATYEEIGRLLGKTPDSVISLIRSTLKLIAREFHLPIEGITDLVSAPETPAASVDGSNTAVHQAECVALETAMADWMKGPEGSTPHRSFLVQIAQRVLPATSTAIGVVQYGSGPTDILPGFYKVANKRNLKGESFLTYRHGDQIFGGDIVMTTGKDTILLVDLIVGYQLCLAPGTLSLCGSLNTQDTSRLTIAGGAGAMLFLPVESKPGELALSFPGGKALSISAAFQVMIRSLTTTRIEVFEGVVDASNASTRHAAGHGDAILCRGGSNPVVGPARKEVSSLNWMVPLTTDSNFPNPPKERILSLLNPPSPKKAAKEKEKKEKEKRGITTATTSDGDQPKWKTLLENNRERLPMVGGVAGVILILIVFLMMRSGGGGPTAATNWMDAASHQRRIQLGIVQAAGPQISQEMTVFTKMGQQRNLVLPSIGFMASPEEATAPLYLTEMAFNQVRSAALAAIQSERFWPKDPNEFLETFCRHLMARSLVDLSHEVPGIPPPLWNYILNVMAPISSYSITPPAQGNPDSDLQMYTLQLTFEGGGSVRYEVAVMRDMNSNNRLYIDILASRWNQGAVGQ